jgi:ribonuclease HII
MLRQDPDMAEELRLYAAGSRAVAGLDEVGRGALAGDVVAAAVILPAEPAVLQRLHGVRDSKQLSPQQRAALSCRIRAEAVAIGLGRVSAQDIDRIGIVQATRRAMALAVAALCVRPDYLIVDALLLPDVPIPQKAIVKGDARCLSIAAASIIAKVDRDAAMVALDGVYPGYGFARHKGYGTSFHRQQLCLMHPCLIHRRSFAPVRAAAVGEGEEPADPAPDEASCLTHVAV